MLLRSSLSTYTEPFLQGGTVTLKLTRLLTTTMALTAALVTLFSIGGTAQQKVPFRGETPIAPTGIPKLRLPDQPVIYDTAEGQQIRVVVHARGLSHPWSLAFLPDGAMLVTERDGRLRLIRNGTLDPAPVEGVPTIRRAGLSGLMDVALHPQFATNKFVYLSYAKPINEKQAATAIARGRWNGSALTDVQDVFVAPVGVGGGARLAFGRDGDHVRDDRRRRWKQPPGSQQPGRQGATPQGRRDSSS